MDTTLSFHTPPRPVHFPDIPFSIACAAERLTQTLLAENIIVSIPFSTHVFSWTLIHYTYKVVNHDP